LSEVIGRDGQLAVSAVDKDGKLNAGGAAVVDEFVECGADRASGEKDIVKEDDVGAFNREGEVRPADGGDGAEVVEVVAVEGDIEGAERGVASAGAEDVIDATAEDGTAGMDSNEGQGTIGMRLDDLRRDALDLVADIGRREQGCFDGLAHGRNVARRRSSEKRCIVGWRWVRLPANRAGGLLEAPARLAGGWTGPPLRDGGATSASTHREKIEVFP
jgi:hypothetical protein